jgi:hypothetical protein
MTDMQARRLEESHQDPRRNQSTRSKSAMNEGRRWKSQLWSEPGRAELEKLTLAPWASRRRRQLLELLDRMDPTIEELTAAAE